jgi:hypothetical protein
MLKINAAIYLPEYRGGALVLCKAAVGSTKTEGGVTYRLNQNHRWERVGDAAAPGQMGLFDMPVVQDEPTPTPHEAWNDDPLAGVTPAGVLRLDSEDAKRFEKFLLASPDPEMLLEMIIPSNWSTRNIKERLKDAKQAISTFVELGVSESSDVYDLSDQLADVFRGKLPPPKDRFLKPVFDLISGVSAGFEELEQLGDSPKELAWELATEYESKRGLKEFRRDLESDMADTSDPKERRGYELHLALLDRVVENLQPINKAIRKLDTLEDKLPEAFWDLEDVDTAIAFSKMYEAALHPTARAIGKLFEDNESEEADTAWEHYEAKATSKLEKAGKPCGRGWIAEKKRCSPDKRQHALKNRRDDLLSYANRKRQEKGLKPKEKPKPEPLPDISLEELDSSEQMLQDSLEKFGEPLKLALQEPPITFEDALNDIKPFNKEQGRLLKSLKGELLDLQKLAKDFAKEQLDRGDGADWDKLSKQIRLKFLAETAAKDRVDRLNRLYTGKIELSDAQTAALLTRIFHTLHPRKMIRVPKGTTQREYYDIVNRLMEEDKKAMKQYTVTRPAKSKRRKKK